MAEYILVQPGLLIGSLAQGVQHPLGFRHWPSFLELCLPAPTIYVIAQTQFSPQCSRRPREICSPSVGESSVLGRKTPEPGFVQSVG